jgi:hypothetical protein
MSTEQPETEKPDDGQPGPQPDAQPGAEQEAQKAEQKARQPRLRELLAIPERDRSDAVWDEIIELEISLAPGNRAAGPQGDGGRRHDPGRGPQPSGGGGRPGRGAFKKSRRRRGG